MPQVDHAFYTLCIGKWGIPFPRRVPEGLSALCPRVLSLLPLSGRQFRAGPQPGLRHRRGPSELGLLTAASFISFAAFQLPLGVLLDRFGPRRIEALLLVVSAVGAFCFGASLTLAGLVIGRALIGFGVSACLMAAFKAFLVWFPKQRLPQVNGFQMAAGALGALAATAPVEAVLALTDWRGISTALAALSLAVAAIVFFVVPEHQRGNTELGFSEQIRGIRMVFTSGLFWRIAPWATASRATFLALLWFFLSGGMGMQTRS